MKYKNIQIKAKKNATQKRGVLKRFLIKNYLFFLL